VSSGMDSGFTCQYDSYFVITQDESVARGLHEQLEIHGWTLSVATRNTAVAAERRIS
jgi:hypothetical protein